MNTVVNINIGRKEIEEIRVEEIKEFMTDLKENNFETPAFIGYLQREDNQISDEDKIAVLISTEEYTKEELVNSIRFTNEAHFPVSEDLFVFSVEDLKEIGYAEKEITDILDKTISVTDREIEAENTFPPIEHNFREGSPKYVESCSYSIGSLMKEALSKDTVELDPDTCSLEPDAKESPAKDDKVPARDEYER